jgi:hypothetical protein
MDVSIGVLCERGKRFEGEFTGIHPAWRVSRDAPPLALYLAEALLHIMVRTFGKPPSLDVYCTIDKAEPRICYLSTL